LNYDELNELTRKASSGDIEALDTLCRSKMKTVMYHTLKYMGNRQDAEDAAQEVMVSICKNISRLKDPASLNVWLQRIINSVCIDYYRKNDREPAKGDIAEYEGYIEERNTEYLPHEQAEQRDIKSLLRSVVDTLPKKRKQAVILYYYDELSYEEIATVMNCSTSTVSTNLMRARDYMKEALQENLTEEYRELNLAISPRSTDTERDSERSSDKTTKVKRTKKNFMDMFDEKIFALLPVALHEEADVLVTGAEMDMLTESLSRQLAGMKGTAAHTVAPTASVSIITRAAKILSATIISGVIVTGGIFFLIGTPDKTPEAKETPQTAVIEPQAQETPEAESYAETIVTTLPPKSDKADEADEAKDSDAAAPSQDIPSSEIVPTAPASGTGSDEVSIAEAKVLDLRIDMLSNLCECGHLNPISAVLAGKDSEGAVTVTWEITGDASNLELGLGQGLGQGQGQAQGQGLDPGTTPGMTDSTGTTGTGSGVAGLAGSTGSTGTGSTGVTGTTGTGSVGLAGSGAADEFLLYGGSGTAVSAELLDLFDKSQGGLYHLIFTIVDADGVISKAEREFLILKE
jgi:RNA polymerase sigma-70 factor (ECF subfamily)